MHSYDSTFHRLLVELLDEQLALQSRLITEQRIKSWEDYLYRVGTLHGLRQAVTLCEEVERRLAGSTS
jgi:hypothetical protein